MTVARAGRLLADIRPLREYPAFRRLWAGSTLSAVGGALTMFAVPLQVYEITRSPFAVGALGVAEMIPTVTIGLLGGAIADAADRRKLVLVITGCSSAVSAGLAVQAFAGLRSVWLLYALAALSASLSAINTPARRTFIPGLLPADQLTAGPVGRIARQGRAMLCAVAVWGAAFAGFAIAATLWLTLVMLAIAGAADTFTVVFRGTIVQQTTPDEFRSRVTAADYVVAVSGGQLGNLEAGALGSLTSPTISALAGGLITVAGAVVVGLALPTFARYRRPHSEPQQHRQPHPSPAALAGPAPATLPY